MTTQNPITILCSNPACKERYTYYPTKGHRRKVCNQTKCEEWNEKQVRMEAAKKADNEAEAFYSVSNRYFENLHGEAKNQFLGNLYEEIKINRHYVPRNLRRAFCEEKVNKFTDKDGNQIPGLAQAFYMFCKVNRGNTPMQIFRQGKESEQATIEKEVKDREASFTVTYEERGEQKTATRSYNSAAWIAANDIEGTIEEMTGGLVKLSLIKEAKVKKAADKAAKSAVQKVVRKTEPKIIESELFE